MNLVTAQQKSKSSSKKMLTHLSKQNGVNHFKFWLIQAYLCHHLTSWQIPNLMPNYGKPLTLLH